MSDSRSTDDVMRAMNERAKAQGRFLENSFSEIPRSPGSILERPDTAESDERIRRVQEYIAHVRQNQPIVVTPGEGILPRIERIAADR